MPNTEKLLKVNRREEGNVAVIGLIVVAILVIAGGAWYFMNSSSSSSTGKQNPILHALTPKTPYSILSDALDKTVAAKTLYLEYQSKIDSSISSSKTGLTQTLHSDMDGTISGSTDGTVTDVEVKLYPDGQPDKSVNISAVNTSTQDWYLKNATTAPKWQHVTKTQMDAENATTPDDASLYGLNILGTIFSQTQALFKSFSKTAVQPLPSPTGGANLVEYQVEVATPDFIAALAKDPMVTTRQADDAKTILKDAVITVNYTVDKSSGYVTAIHIEAKNLTQIESAEITQAGLSAVQNITLDATLSRFGVATNIAAPAAADVIETK